MRPIFRDPILQERYDREGYVVVPFYTEEDIKELNNIYEALNSKLEDRGFYISIMSQNLAYKEKVHHLIKGIASKPAQDLLIDCNFITSSFAVKKAGKETMFDLHQGINFTDESLYDTFTAWSPLIDVNENNGCLFVLPGSHKLWHQIRKTPDFIPAIRNIKEHLWEKYAIEIKMKAGEALVFHHRLIHGSKPNFGNSIRVATLNAFIPKEAPLLLYTSKTLDINDRELEVYQFHKDNYYTLDVLRKPDYLDGVELIDTAKEEVLTLTEQEYDSMYENMLAGTHVI